VIRAIVTACLVCLGGAALAQDTSGSDQDTATSGQGAVLRGLDKVNGQTVDVEVHSGGAATVFGLGSGVGWAIAIVGLAGIREKLK